MVTPTSVLVSGIEMLLHAHQRTKTTHKRRNAIRYRCAATAQTEAFLYPTELVRNEHIDLFSTDVAKIYARRLVIVTPYERLVCHRLFGR